MFKSLLKIQFRSMFEGGRSKGRQKGLSRFQASMIAIVLIVISMAMPLVLFFRAMTEIFLEQDMEWLFWSQLAFFSVIAGVISTLFSTYQLLFHAKDNERLLAMPIPPGMILLVRTVSLYLLSLFADLFFLIPASVGFLQAGGAGASLLWALPLFLLLPLISLTLSIILGALIAFLGQYIPFKNFFALLFGLAGMTLYFYFVFFLQDRMGELLGAGIPLAGAMRDVLPPLYSLGQAITGKNAGQLLLYLAWVLVPFALTLLVIAFFFRRLLTRREYTARVEYKGSRQGRTPVFPALLLREVKRVLSLPMVLLNGGIGLLGSLFFSGTLLLRKEMILEALDQFRHLLGPGAVTAAAVAALSLIALSNSLSAASISLEGQQLWLLKSLPLASGDILLSKALFPLLINHPPVLLATAVYALTLPVEPGFWALLLLLPLAAGLYSSLLGVLINVYYPKLEWPNETAAVKQSLSIVLHMLAVFATAGLLIFLYVSYISRTLAPRPFLFIVLGVFTALSLLLYGLLMTKGVRRLEQLDA